MSTWSRISNLFRGNRIDQEINEELESHIAEAIANGRDPEEARRAFGSLLRHREASRDARLITWLDALRADAIFGLRQLRKNKITSAAAILSLALVPLRIVHVDSGPVCPALVSVGNAGDQSAGLGSVRNGTEAR